MGITIGICVRNGAKYIMETLRALEGQTVRPDQVLVINDHSTDNTKDILKSFQSTTKLGFSFHDINGKGLFDGRNHVLSLAKNEIVAFTDADCVPSSDWVEQIMRVFKEHPDVVGGTGSHPGLEEKNFVSKLHKWWFIVEGVKEAGYTQGVIGANCYFRKSALEEVGGWIHLEVGNAEDVYIAHKLTELGMKLWHDPRVQVAHHYATEWPDFLRKTYRSGYAITLMMREVGIRTFLYYYTMIIPVVALWLLAGVFALAAGKFQIGLALISSVLALTFLFNLRMFRTVSNTLPRWFTRWIIIWGYSAGILAGFMKRIKRHNE